MVIFTYFLTKVVILEAGVKRGDMETLPSLPSIYEKYFHFPYFWFLLEIRYFRIIDFTRFSPKNW